MKSELIKQAMVNGFKEELDKLAISPLLSVGLQAGLMFGPSLLGAVTGGARRASQVGTATGMQRPQKRIPITPR